MLVYKCECGKTHDIVYIHPPHARHRPPMVACDTFRNPINPHLIVEQERIPPPTRRGDSV